MSVRTNTLSALTVALLTATASAQPPAMVPPAEPVHPMVAPPMPVPPEGVRVAVPPLGPVPLTFDLAFPVPPRATDNRQVFNFSVGLFGSQGACATPATTTGGPGPYCPSAPPQPMTVRPNRPDLRIFSGYDVPQLATLPPMFTPSVLPAAALDVQMTPPVCPPCPLPKIEPNPLLGTWYREFPQSGTVAAVTFTADELTLCLTQAVDGHTVAVTLTAHYARTADGLVFGAVTGGDAAVRSPGANSELVAQAADIAERCHRATDTPFSFRAKFTSAGLMVSGLKCQGQFVPGEAGDFGGLFKPAKDGKVPAPTAVENRRGPAEDDRVLPPPPPLQRSSTTLPNGVVVERVGVDFTAPAPMLTPPAPAPVCESCPNKTPHLDRLYKNVGPVPCPPTSCLPPPPAPTDGTKQLAGDAFNSLLQQSGVIRPADLPLLPPPVRPVAATVPAAPRPVAVGTWTRDVAGKLCVVKVEADHLTLTVHDAQEVNGKVSTASLVLTADYHLTRDGQTAVGLITSVDVSFEGEFPAEDTRSFFELLSDLQKTLEGKPFALTFRAYGDALAIGNVRLPQSDQMDKSFATYLSGRYKAAGDKAPKPKPVKAPAEPRPGFVPSSQELPVPGLPGSAPTGDLIPPQTVPPTRGVPMAPPPAPGRTGALPPAPLQPYSGDPNVRMQHLFQQNDDLRQIHNQWRRLWFNDQPSHLTPERIHGGIY